MGVSDCGMAPLVSSTSAAKTLRWCRRSGLQWVSHQGACRVSPQIVRKPLHILQRQIQGKGMVRVRVKVLCVFACVIVPHRVRVSICGLCVYTVPKLHSGVKVVRCSNCTYLD